jgi:hypothetical protein
MEVKQRKERFEDNGSEEGLIKERKAERWVRICFLSKIVKSVLQSVMRDVTQ